MAAFNSQNAFCGSVDKVLQLVSALLCGDIHYATTSTPLPSAGASRDGEAGERERSELLPDVHGL